MASYLEGVAPKEVVVVEEAASLRSTVEGAAQVPGGLVASYPEGDAAEEVVVVEEVASPPPVRKKAPILCKFFAGSGCNRGEACAFAHGKEELLEADADPVVPRYGYKKAMCKFYDGPTGCNKGERCTFAHGEAELAPALVPASTASLERYKVAPCWQLETKGECSRGANCRFAHGEGELILAKWSPMLNQDVIDALMTLSPEDMTVILQNFEAKSDTVRDPSGYLFRSYQNALAHGAQSILVPAKEWKSTLCWHFEQKGHCSRGQSCNFAHGEGDLHGGAAVAVPLVMCRDFASPSGCTYGDYCKFSHDVRLELLSKWEDSVDSEARKALNALPLEERLDLLSDLEERYAFKTIMNPSAVVQKACLHWMASGTAGVEAWRSAPPAAAASSWPAPYKTVLCWHFGTAKGCSLGERCRFAHGEEELQEAEAGDQEAAAAAARQEGLETMAGICNGPEADAWFNGDDALRCQMRRCVQLLLKKGALLGAEVVEALHAVQPEVAHKALRQLMQEDEDTLQNSASDYVLQALGVGARPTASGPSPALPADQAEAAWGATSAPSSPVAGTTKKSKRVVCKEYMRERACSAGDACPFAHVFFRVPARSRAPPPVAEEEQEEDIAEPSWGTAERHLPPVQAQKALGLAIAKSAIPAAPPRLSTPVPLSRGSGASRPAARASTGAPWATSNGAAVSANDEDWEERSRREAEERRERRRREEEATREASVPASLATSPWRARAQPARPQEAFFAQPVGFEDFGQSAEQAEAEAEEARRQWFEAQLLIKQEEERRQRAVTAPVGWQQQAPLTAPAQGALPAAGGGPPSRPQHRHQNGAGGVPRATTPPHASSPSSAAPPWAPPAAGQVAAAAAARPRTPTAAIAVEPVDDEDFAPTGGPEPPEPVCPPGWRAKWSERRLRHYYFRVNAEGKAIERNPDGKVKSYWQEQYRAALQREGAGAGAVQAPAPSAAGMAAAPRATQEIPQRPPFGVPMQAGLTAASGSEDSPPMQQRRLAVARRILAAEADRALDGFVAKRRRLDTEPQPPSGTSAADLVASAGYLEAQLRTALGYCRQALPAHLARPQVAEVPAAIAGVPAAARPGSVEGAPRRRPALRTGGTRPQDAAGGAANGEQPDG